MSSKWIAICLPLALAAAGPAPAQERPTTVVTGPPTAAAPAFRVGDTVVDQSGAPIGVVAGVGEGANALMQLVVKIDGKLVTVPETVLSFRGGRLVSARSKAELLAVMP